MIAGVYIRDPECVGGMECSMPMLVQADACFCPGVHILKF